MKSSPEKLVAAGAIAVLLALGASSFLVGRMIASDRLAAALQASESLAPPPQPPSSIPEFEAEVAPIVRDAVARNPVAIKARWSPAALKTTSADFLDRFFKEQLFPFFASYRAMGAVSIVRPAHTRTGRGFGFYRSIVAGDADGKERPFVVYLLRERGRIVIGNILLGRSFEDLHPARKPGLLAGDAGGSDEIDDAPIPRRRSELRAATDARRARPEGGDSAANGWE